MVRIENNTVVAFKVVKFDIFEIRVGVGFGDGGCVMHNASIVDNIRIQSAAVEFL